MPAPTFAALDIGTNTVLLLVARAGAAGALEVLEESCRTPRLGSGLARHGAIEAGNAERALSDLEEFAARLAAHGVPRSRTRAVGTAVLRRARNAAEFVAAARARCGLEIEVLGEEEEAELAHLAVESELAGARAAVIDVGGGSSEYTSADGRTRLSAPVGAVLLSEQHPGHGAAVAAAQLAVARAACARFPAGDARGEDLVVLGGTALNLACLEGRFESFDPERAEGARVEVAAARRWCEELALRTVEERLRFPIERERAAILHAGLACLAAALERVEPARLRVSGRGLRYGVLRALLARA